MQYSIYFIASPLYGIVLREYTYRWIKVSLKNKDQIKRQCFKQTRTRCSLVENE